MSKVVLVIIAVVIVAVLVLFFILAQSSSSGVAIGIVDGRLARCTSKPNCVCSEYKEDAAHYIEPILISRDNSAKIKTALKTAIQKMAGNIVSETDNYIAVTFTSRLFGFVDDLEIRIDTDNNLVQLRSASRVGYSDAGINKQRIQRLKELVRKDLHH